MLIQEFATRFGVECNVHYLRDYTLLLGPNAFGVSGRQPRSRWVLSYVCSTTDRIAQHVLTVDHETSSRETNKDVDALELLATAIVDARDGTLTFAEYVEQWGNVLLGDDGQYTTSTTPSQLHTQWRRMGVLHDDIHQWCSSTEMRDALDTIELS
jgi:hypothetical protein